MSSTTPCGAPTSSPTAELTTAKPPPRGSGSSATAPRSRTLASRCGLTGKRTRTTQLMWTQNGRRAWAKLAVRARHRRGDAALDRGSREDPRQRCRAPANSKASWSAANRPCRCTSRQWWRRATDRLREAATLTATLRAARALVGELAVASRDREEHDREQTRLHEELTTANEDAAEALEATRRMGTGWKRVTDALGLPEEATPSQAKAQLACIDELVGAHDAAADTPSADRHDREGPGGVRARRAGACPRTRARAERAGRHHDRRHPPRRGIDGPRRSRDPGSARATRTGALQSTAGRSRAAREAARDALGRLAARAGVTRR